MNHVALASRFVEFVRACALAALLSGCDSGPGLTPVEQLSCVTPGSGTLPPTVELTQPMERSVFQRNANNIAIVPIEGTLLGAACRIEARAVAREDFAGRTTAWTLVAEAPSGGPLASSLPVSAGWYDIEVRIVHEGGLHVETAVERVGIGEVFLTAGQSNSANHGDPPQPADDDRVCALDPLSGEWQLADDPQPYADGSGGSPWPQLGDLLAAELDMPVGFVSVGVGGTSVAQWDLTGHYTRLQTAILALRPYGVRAVLWHQGESDSLAGTSAADYAATLERIIGESRKDAGFDLPWFVALASWLPFSTAADEAQVIEGQLQVIARDDLVFQGSSTDSFHLAEPKRRADSVHFNTLGLEAHALQWFDALVPWLP